jgi:energy-converting hydrogenase Eha subunit G
MTMIDRRTMLKTLLGGVAVAASGVVLATSQADSAPLTVSEPEGIAPVSSVEKAVFVSGRRRPPKPSPHNLQARSRKKGM